MEANSVGKYIVIEGVHGAGKTTQKNILRDAIIQNGTTIIDPVETGSTALGQAIREIVNDPSIEKQSKSELDLFIAAGKELVQQVIEPSIQSGQNVICDRNWFSCVAYEGFGRGLKVYDIIERSKRAMGDYFMPDGAVILDIPIYMTNKRLTARGDGSDWYESQGRDFFQKVQLGYHWIAEEYSVPVLNGELSIEEVKQNVFNRLGTIVLSK